MRILGIDPGGTTGVAIIKLENRVIVPVLLDQIKTDKVTKLRDLISSVDVVVIENFLVRPGKSRQGAFDRSSMPTSQEIGSIKTLCELLEKPYQMQEPSNKPVGYGFANLKYVPGKQGTHMQDALAHAVFYAVKHQKAYPVTPKK